MGAAGSSPASRTRLNSGSSPLMRSRFIIPGMAIYEVTIEGSLVAFEENEEGEPFPCLSEESFSFTKEGQDLIETMMAVQADVDIMNAALKAKYPEHYKDDTDWEFKIVGVVKTCLIHFNKTWIKEFVEDGVLTRNYNEDCDL